MALLSDEGGRFAEGKHAACLFLGSQGESATVFDLSTDGMVANMTDMNRLKANINLKARTYNLGMVTAMLDPALTQEIRIPSGIGIQGNVKMDGTKYATRLALTEGKGSMKVDATMMPRPVGMAASI